MRRFAPAIVFVVLLLASCVSAGEPPPGSTATGSSASGSVSGNPPPIGTPTQSPTPSPVRQPDLQLPADAPTTLDDPADVAGIEAGDHAPILPPGAEETSVISHVEPDGPIDQITLAWRRGLDPFASEVGLVVWQRFEQSPTWRAVYAFTERPKAGVLGVRLSSADLTGDGVDDLLTEEQRGGSGACATWRVIASAAGSAAEIFLRDGCDTEISAINGTLEIREAVYEPGDPHCCPSAYRTTVLAWDGQAWQQLSSELKPVR